MSTPRISRQEWLENVALDIVAEGWRPTFHQLQHELQVAGASHREANETIAALTRRREIKTTMRGGIVLRNSRPEPRPGRVLEITASILGIVVALLGIWEIGARNG